jgi:ubiquinol-cytochrome c reductase iron-sulfur subunit
MALSSRAATQLVRHASRQQLPALRSSAAAIQRRKAGTDASSSDAQFTSPFHRGTRGEQDTTVIPDFGKYKSKGSEQGNRLFQYFMVGAFGGLSALGAKDTVQRSSLPTANTHPNPQFLTNDLVNQNS